MAECGQCGREAIYQLPGGQLLCAHCWSLIQQNNLSTMYASMRMINYYSDLMADMVGLPRSGPHIELPNTTVLQGGQVNLRTVNNIHVQPGSQVGQINAGAIINIDRAVSIFNRAGSPETASALQAFTQSVLDSAEISADNQKRILESLQFLVSEAAKTAESRNSSVFRAVLLSIAPLVQTVGAISGQWENLRSIFEKLTGGA